MFFKLMSFSFDQNNSAIAAVLGQILESIFLDVTNSLHIVTSPPKILSFSSFVKTASFGIIGER